MATIKKFEDLMIWQKARELSNEVFELTCLPTFNDNSLINQIRRSSGSIMDNIAEGFERDGNKEFKQFLSISKGSSGELRSQLYRALDWKFISSEQFDKSYNKSEEISKMISNFIIYLKNTEIKGNKFSNTKN